jgi:hypothetical protein
MVFYPDLTVPCGGPVQDPPGCLKTSRIRLDAGTGQSEQRGSTMPLGWPLPSLLALLPKLAT